MKFGDNSKIKSLDSIMGFGKYRDFTVQEVLNTNPHYLIWASDTVRNFELEPDILAQAEELSFERDMERGSDYTTGDYPAAYFGPRDWWGGDDDPY